MRFFPNSGLQVRLFFLILLAIVPTAGALFYTAMEERREHLMLARQETMRLASLAAEYQERVIENTHHLLGVLSRLPEVRSPGAVNCSSMLAEQMRHLTAYTNLGVADLSGNVVCSAVPLERPVNIGDRSYFMRALKKDGFATGEYQIGRITRKPAVNFGYPVKDASGNTVGVVYAALGVDQIGPVLDNLYLPEGATVSVIDSKGTLVFRYPENLHGIVGETIPMEPDVRLAMTAVEGGSAEAMGTDGIMRVYAIIPLHSPPDAPSGLFLRLGVPKDHVLASTHIMTVRNSAVLVAGCLLAFAAAWLGGRRFIINPVRSLVGLSRRLAKGDLHARAGFTSSVAELADLARALDDMAWAIEVRERQLAATISEQGQTLQALKESETKFRTIFEQSPAGIVIIDQKSLLPVAFNDTAHLQLGYSGEEFSRLMISDYEAAEKPDETLAHADKIRNEGCDHFETLHRTKEGGVRNVEVTVNTIHLSGEPFFYCTFHDITEMRQAEAEVRRLNARLEKRVSERTFELRGANRALEQANEKLRELERLKSVFIASMSHELKTPLNSIIGFSDVLLNEWSGSLTDQQRENVSTIHRSGKHLLSLISDVIDVSRIEAGKLDATISSFDLRDAVNEAISMLKKDAADKGLALDLEVPHMDMLTDRQRLMQCLINLLANAVKYTEKGRICVRTQNFDRGIQDREFVEIAVEDTGVGIKEEDMPRLFTPFARLDTHLTVSTKGTGLGLYLTRKLAVDVLGGEIAAASEYGKGSRFMIRVPVKMESAVSGDSQ